MQPSPQQPAVQLRAPPPFPPPAPPPLPPGWERLVDPASGASYLANKATGQTQWE
jgi:hypothetical protein